MSAGLELQGVRVGWDGVPVLDDVTLLVPAGTTLALLGESGSGKSTLLRTVAGLLDVQAGTIMVGDRDVTHVPAHRRNIGMVFQGHALFPHATVGANISFAASLRGADRVQRREIAERWLAMVGLEGLAERDVATLSGGQRQRVALARSLAAEPDVLLLDEPLGALDAGRRATVLADLNDLFGRLGTTVVHVTHDPVEAATLADTIAVLDAGRVAEVGSPVELHRRPGSATVARLLGHPNVLEASSMGMTAPPGCSHLIVPTHALTVGPALAGTTSLRATVTLIAPGPVWTAVVQLASGALVTITLDEADPPQPGTIVDLRLDTQAVLWVPHHSDGAAQS